MVNQNSPTVELGWEKIEGNPRRANTQLSMDFRRVNAETSMDFRKANTEQSMDLRKTNTESY
jgi:hypothetical protein